jgi:DNA-directed RNA polymerase specialized sigma24 family protein
VGTTRAAELAEPDHAAAWLRRHVLRDIGRHARSSRPPGGRAALEGLGVDAAAFAALSALTVRERAALVANTVERLPAAGLATVLGVGGTRLDKLMSRARRRAVAAAASNPGDRSGDDGPIVTSIRAIAAQTLT